MRTSDRESGIRGIEYNVTDVITGSRIWNGTVKGQKETTVVNKRSQTQPVILCRQ